MQSGQFLRARRLVNGLTQAQLARRAGTSQAFVSQIENGEKSPTVDTLSRLLGVMGEDLRLEAAPTAHRYRRADLAAEAGRAPEERLAGALAWNEFGTELAGAAQKGRPPHGR
ncbi:helix-turn-helix domain-containing protein [Capillimicrobium parvum]|nr:helix-turn-helix transcriptional regulator [Capillimicrobium parvum]